MIQWLLDLFIFFSYLSRVLFTSLGQKMSRYSWSWQGARMPVEGLTWKTSSVAKWNWICEASGLSRGSRGCKLGFMICQWKGSSKWLYSEMKKGERNRHKMCYLLISERNFAVAKNNNTESETEFISISLFHPGNFSNVNTASTGAWTLSSVTLWPKIWKGRDLLIKHMRRATLTHCFWWQASSVAQSEGCMGWNG